MRRFLRFHLPGLHRHVSATLPIWALALSGLLFSPASGDAQEEAVLIREGDDWRYFKGVKEPSPDPITGEPTTEWTELGFDDAQWLVGPSGIGYGDGDDRTVLSDMRGTYLSVYTRHRFTVESVDGVEVLALSLDYDDGFIAYLNGAEVARAGVGVAGTPARFNATATLHEANGAETFAIDAGLLEPGDNVLAIQVQNANLNSSDLSFIPELVVNPDLCPDAETVSCAYNLRDQSVTLRWTNETTYDVIEVWRNDVLLDGFVPGNSESYTDTVPLAGEQATYRVVAVAGGDSCPGLECSVFAFEDRDILIREGDIWLFFRGTQPLPAGWTELEFDDADWEFGPTGIGYGDGDDSTVLDDMENIAGVQEGYLTVLCRRTLEIESLEGAEFLLNVIYDDGVVAHVNGEEIGRVNMPGTAIDELTAALQAGEPSVVDFTIPRELLRVGDNVIAVSVHNANLGSSDLSFIPTLVRIAVEEPEGRFRRGDSDANGQVNLTDAITILNHLFRGREEPPCLDAADTDDSGQINLTDSVRLLNHLFLGAPPTPPPGLQCGVDPTDDAFVPCSTPGC